MAIRKSYEITDVSKLEMYDFRIEAVNGYDETVLITGDRGYPRYYRVEAQFFDVKYLACAPSFGAMGTFLFRQATEQEATTLYEDYLEHPPQAVYCFEEDLSRWSPMPKRKAHKFFIVANSVEITIHYDAENVHHLSGFEKREGG
ncbi:MAG TPA: hypothetical protein VFV38_12455 [Ktedonobacteraceae bacterium]|nr:hypothetical protein [Ktedonobacteraceae bacterium]